MAAGFPDDDSAEDLRDDGQGDGGSDPHSHEEAIGLKLHGRLADFLRGATPAVVPGQEMAMGMGVRTESSVDHFYDPEADAVIVTGTVTLSVRRERTEPMTLDEIVE